MCAKALLYVLAIPEFSSDGAHRLASLRNEHCPLDQHGLPAHITLMYALPEDTSEIVCQAASESAQHHQTFDLTLAGVIMEHAPPDSNYYLFARPERGRTELHALHEDLYETYPEAQNYLLKPFQPHVTIGIFEEQTQCERTLEIAGRDRWDVRGRVKSLTVIRYTVGVGDEMLAEYELGAKSPSC